MAVCASAADQLRQVETLLDAEGVDLVTFTAAYDDPPRAAFVEQRMRAWPLCLRSRTCYIHMFVLNYCWHSSSYMHIHAGFLHSTARAHADGCPATAFRAALVQE